MVVPMLRGRCAEMDHGIVPCELLILRGAKRRPELADRSRPISQTIKSAAIAKHDRRTVAVRRVLQLALNVEDGPLRGATAGWIVFSREPAAKDQACRTLT